MISVSNAIVMDLTCTDQMYKLECIVSLSEKFQTDVPLSVMCCVQCAISEIKVLCVFMNWTWSNMMIDRSLQIMNALKKKKIKSILYTSN